MRVTSGMTGDCIRVVVRLLASGIAHDQVELTEFRVSASLEIVPQPRLLLWVRNDGSAAMKISRSAWESSLHKTDNRSVRNPPADRANFFKNCGLPTFWV